MILTTEGISEAIEAYENCVPMDEIAGWFGVTRQAIWKRFKALGVETRKGIATRRRVECETCGVEYELTRSAYRRSKKRFCSDTCYHIYLQNNDSVINRHMQRLARAKVAEVFDLQDGQVVHHIDFNHWNLDLSNLMVFASQSDHIKFHHELRREGDEALCSVKPVWNGRK